MPSGGARKGAGRKKGAFSEEINALRAKLTKEMGAMLEDLRKDYFSGKCSIAEKTQIAKLFSSKCLPDLQRTEHVGEDVEGIHVILTDYRSSKNGEGVQNHKNNQNIN